MTTLTGKFARHRAPFPADRTTSLELHDGFFRCVGSMSTESVAEAGKLLAPAGRKSPVEPRGRLPQTAMVGVETQSTTLPPAYFK
jgi:hypothetical protein